MEALRETVLVAGQDLRRTLRSAKAWVLLAIYATLTVLAGVGVALWADRATRALEAELQAAGASPELVAQQTETALLQLAMTFGGDEAQARYFLTFPLVVLFSFWAARVGLPLLVSVVTFDQVSGETANRSLRYVLVRGRRGAVLAGKLLANGALFAGVMLVTNVVLLVAARWVAPGLPLGDALVDTLHLYLLTLPLALFWIALSALASVLFRTPIVSLMALLGAMTLWVLLAALSWVWPVLGWLVPWRANALLLAPGAGAQLAGVGVYLGLAAVAGAGAWLALRRGDV